MEMKNTFNLILNSKIVKIPFLFENLVHINTDIFNALILNHQYEVQTKVSDEIFQSFIDYLVKGTPPTILPENYEEYSRLNQEFQFQLIEPLIQTVKSRCNDLVSLYVVNELSSDDEFQISQNLDYYLDMYSESLMKQPIEVLLRIFNHPNRKLTKHNTAYEIIRNKYQLTKNIEIYQLLPTLDGDKLTYENFYECIIFRNSRNKQIPRIDIFNLLDKNEKIFDLLTKKNEMISPNKSYSITSKLYEACIQGNIELVRWLTRDEIKGENGMIFKIDHNNKQAAVAVMPIRTPDVFIPRSVIKKNAFGLDEEYIVTTIIAKCFADWIDVKTVKFPYNSELQIIKEKAFFKSIIESFVIPPKVTFIGESAFQFCIELKSVTFPENSELKSIEKNAFFMSAIENVFIPSNVTKIKECAFYKTEKLKKIEFGINSKLNLIADSAFSCCSLLEYVKIPQHVTKLGYYAFSACNNLKTVEFSENSELEIIGEHCFHGIPIERIIIPSKVKIIESCAFKSCNKLKSVEFSENSELETIGQFAFSGTLIEYFFVHKNVTKIGRSSFSSHLKVIDFDQNSKLKIIKAIFDNTDIEHVKFPPSVTQIEDCTFYFCTKLKTVHFPENSELKYIDSGTFVGSSIESLSIPSKLIEFKENWCLGTQDLKKIIIPKSNPYYIFKDDKFLLGKTDQKSDIFDILIFCRRDIKEVNIPSNIKIISSSTFDSCKQLQTIDFSNAFELIQFIGKSSFSDTNIENITIPPHATSIEYSSFSGCKRLKTVHIPENSDLEYIDNEAFFDSSIESLSIPSKLIEFKEGWCSRTMHLKKIMVQESNPYYIFKDDKFLLGKTDQKSDIFDILIFCRRDIKKVIIPSNIKIISSHSFNFCKLEVVDFEENSKLKKIGQNAFSFSSIRKLSFPSHLEKIEESTFDYCNNLKTVQFHENCELKTIGKKAFSSTTISCFSIPLHVKFIGDFAFSYCKNLKIIEILGNSETVFFGKSLFSDSTLEIIMVQPNFKLIHK